jgi:hypothetical protein
MDEVNKESRVSRKSGDAKHQPWVRNRNREKDRQSGSGVRSDTKKVGARRREGRGGAAALPGGWGLRIR